MKESMHTIIVKRKKEDDYQTLGELSIHDNKMNEIFSCKTIELPWKDNKKNESRIPKGEYVAVRHTSPKFGECLWIQDVPGRSEILIHVANFRSDLRGCIGVGESFVDIDGDGHKDVTSSKSTMNALLNELDGDLFAIHIEEEF